MEKMIEKNIRIYGSGAEHDEGGKFHFEKRQTPVWVEAAKKICGGCHDNFYNYRGNCTGDSWCFSLQKKYAGRKTKPPCFH